MLAPNHEQAEPAVNPASLLEAYFDAPYYLKNNTDVAENGCDPLHHYLTFGHKEGRNPSAFFYTQWYRDTYQSVDPTTCPLLHFVRFGTDAGNKPHPLIDPQFIAREYLMPPSEVLPSLIAKREQIDRLCEWFSGRAYCDLYPDVGSGGDVALSHFMPHGLREGRRPHPGFIVLEETVAASRITRDPREVVARFRWAGKAYQVERTAVPAVIAEQILKQGIFDTRIFAPGHQCMPHLPQLSATDLVARLGLDHRALLKAVGEPNDVVILHPGLCLGGAEKYTAQLVRTLDKELGIRPLVLTTQGTEQEDFNALQLANLRPLRDVRVASIGPLLSRVNEPPTTLALLLMALAPKHLFVINSYFGHEALRMHGRALASVSKILVSFFSDSPNAIGSPYATRYLFDLIHHTHIFADNNVVLETLSERLGHQMRERFVLLPQSVEMPSHSAFERALKHRLDHRNKTKRPRILWLSRWSPHKATDIVCELARTRPDLHIDAFGVPPEAKDFPSLPNLQRHPVLQNLDSLPLEVYDAFMFTSRFEGMPNVALEMAARGIPCISSDVGGLREVFDDACVDFVSAQLPLGMTVRGFSDGIDAILRRSNEALVTRVRKARAAVESRHSSAAFAQRLRGVLNQRANAK